MLIFYCLNTRRLWRIQTAWAHTITREPPDTVPARTRRRPVRRSTRLRAHKDRLWTSASTGTMMSFVISLIEAVYRDRLQSFVPVTGHLADLCFLAERLTDTAGNRHPKAEVPITWTTTETSTVSDKILLNFRFIFIFIPEFVFRAAYDWDWIDHGGKKID